MLGITTKFAPSFTVATHVSWPRISLSGDTTELAQPREDKRYWWNLSCCLPEDTLRPMVNTGPQPGLTYNMMWALQNQSPPSFLVLSCLTCWRMWGSRGQTKTSPGWPIRWRELCPEHWSMHPAPGGGGAVLLMSQSNECKLGAFCCRLSEAPWAASLVSGTWSQRTDLCGGSSW